MDVTSRMSNGSSLENRPLALSVEIISPSAALEPCQIERIDQHHGSISKSHHRDNRTAAQSGAKHAGNKASFFNRREHDRRLPYCGMEPRVNQQRTNTEQRSEEHTSELQSLRHLVCRLLLEKKKT